MTGTEQPLTGPAWVQILLSVIGVLGGTGGALAVAAVALRRRRFRSEAAELLTDTALTIVRPLRRRLRELEIETAQARGQALAAEREISELRVRRRELATVVRRWRAAIMDPDATISAIRDHIRGGRTARPDECQSP